MALQMSWTDTSGVLHPEAYVRYTGFYADVPEKEPVMEVTINIYHNRDTRLKGLSPVAGGHGRIYPVVGLKNLAIFHTAVDYRLAAYRFLKAVQFPGAVDVLEPGQVA